MERERQPISAFGLDTKMAPMIDVIFQLLIFFLCTATFASPEAVLPTRLPDEGETTTAPPRPPEDVELVRVELLGDETAQRIRLNGVEIRNMEELFRRLSQVARISPRAPVVLDVGQDVPIGRAIEVYDGSLRTGLSSVHFAARRKAGSSEATPDSVE